MQKIKDIFLNIKLWSLRRKIFFGVLLFVVILILYKALAPVDNSANTLTDFAKRVDLKETVLATGQVTSETDLSLSFNATGVVKSMKVAVGDNVKKGQILATLDQGSQLASLTSARGSLAAAQARYKRTVEGSSNEELALSRVALDNAKKDLENVKTQQEVLVSNAYKTLLNSTPQATPEVDTNDYVAPTITGSYTLGKEGDIILKTYYSSGGISYALSGLVSGSGQVSTNVPQPIANSGLYITFPAASSTSNWIISIPNKKSTYYLSNLNAYQAALNTKNSAVASASALVDQRTAELALKSASARGSDIDLANADIITAQGQFQAASANYENTILRAPADGTITKVDTKLGELVQTLKEVMVLQDVKNVYLEANINEANIARVTVDSVVDITFDSLGSDKIFKGKILKIDPASTVVSGVVNYKVTASVDSIVDIRPGMTANMTILINEKSGVITVPSRAVLTAKDGTRTIRIVTDTKKKKFTEVPVTIGISGDGGLVEVLSGVKEGDEVVTLIKKA